MERLNALSLSLPPEQPPTNQVIESLNNELSQDFKLAANAVTKLYRVANERNSLLKHQGYLQCLEDILSILGQNSSVSLEVIHLWCLKQRNDILSDDAVTTTDNSQNSTSPNKFDFDFDTSKALNKNNADIGMPKFRLSRPPPSVEHMATNYKPKKTKWIKRQPVWYKQDKLPRENDIVEEEQRFSHHKLDQLGGMSHHSAHHHHYYGDVNYNDSSPLDRPKTRIGTELGLGPKKKQRPNKKDP